MEIEENQSKRNCQKSKIFDRFSEHSKNLRFFDAPKFYEFGEPLKNKKFFEVISICNLCRKAGKMYTCSLCGNIVCKDCYDIAKGICKPCKRNPGKTI